MTRMTPEREEHLRKLARYYLHQRLVDAHEASEALTEALDALSVVRRERDDYYGSLKLQQEPVRVSAGGKTVGLIHSFSLGKDFPLQNSSERKCMDCYYRHSNFMDGIGLKIRCEHPDGEERGLLPDQSQPPDWCPFKAGRKP